LYFVNTLALLSLIIGIEKKKFLKISHRSALKYYLEVGSYVIQ